MHTQKAPIIAAIAAATALIALLSWPGDVEETRRRPSSPHLAESSGPREPNPVAAPRVSEGPDVKALVLEIEALRSTLTDIRDAQRVLSEQVAEIAAPASGLPDASSQNDPTKDVDSAIAEREAKERFRRDVTDFEDRLASEAPDPGWSDWATEEIEHELEAQEVPGARLLASECSTTLCRMEFAFDDEHSRESSSGMLPMLLPTEGHGFWLVDEHDPLKIVIFANRHLDP